MTPSDRAEIARLSAMTLSEKNLERVQAACPHELIYSSQGSDWHISSFCMDCGKDFSRDLKS